jgi:hypothetical protein
VQWNISKRGLDTGKTHKRALQKLLYRCVADAWTTQKANKRKGLARFGKLAAQPYDDRIFRTVAGNKAGL